MAKGKDFAIIKEHNGMKYKEFEEIKFMHLQNELNVTIVNIAAGDQHVIALDFNRNIWGWGSNKYKQINPYSDEKFFKIFVKIDYTKYKKKFKPEYKKAVIIYQ